MDSLHQRSLRYGEFLGAVRHKQRLIAYRDVHAADRHAPPRMRLRFIDLHRLLTPYFSVRFFEQLRAVTPLALMLAAFLTLLLRSDVRESESIAIGIVMVMVGLMFFMEGVKHGLMPFSEHIGYALPEKAPTAMVLLVAIILGAMATFAEPAVGALRAAGARVSATEAPLLYLMLNGRADALVAAVGLGVGLAVAVGMLRYVMGWRLKVLALLTLVPALGLTIFAASDPLLAPLLGLAWDCGAITTGPVTVPLVLSLGIGVAASSGRGDSPLSGFGLVTLASLFPVVSVLLLGIILKGEAAGVTAAAVSAALAPMAPVSPPPVPQVLDALRAIVPLVLFLWFVQRVGLRQRLRNRDVLAYGIVLAILGMAVFNLGLTTGLVALGDQAGSGIPLAFGGAGVKPLYPYVVGVVLTLGFALLLGYGATVAEPALAAMGATVENLTDGAFRKRLLVRAVAIGVGFGTTVGVARIIFGWPVVWLVLAGYAVAVVLTLLSTEDYVNLAWDSGGVTTGPVTVPLILALGAGLGEATGARDGFGILAMASVGPIIAVLGVGLWVRHAARWRNAREQ